MFSLNSPTPPKSSLRAPAITSAIVKLLPSLVYEFNLSSNVETRLRRNFAISFSGVPDHAIQDTTRHMRSQDSYTIARWQIFDIPAPICACVRKRNKTMV